MTTKYYKALTHDGKGPFEKTTKFSLPTRRGGVLKPGLWHTVVGPLKMCRNGIHVATTRSIRRWGPNTEHGYPAHLDRRVFQVEVLKGTQRIRGPYKICVRTMRVLREVHRESDEWIALGLAHNIFNPPTPGTP
jgi:hypothetical protein